MRDDAEPSPADAEAGETDADDASGGGGDETDTLGDAATVRGPEDQDSTPPS